MANKIFTNLQQDKVTGTQHALFLQYSCFRLFGNMSGLILIILQLTATWSLPTACTSCSSSAHCWRKKASYLRTVTCSRCRRSTLSLTCSSRWTSLSSKKGDGAFTCICAVTKYRIHHTITCMHLPRLLITYACNSILTQYQRLAICIRRGSSTVESTLFVPPSSSTQGSGGGGNSGSSSSGGSSSRKLPAPSAADRLPGSEELVSLFAMKNSTAGTVSSTSVKTARPGSVALPASGASNRDLTTVAAAQQGSAREGAAGASALSVQQSTDAAVQLLASLPSSDHALAYVVLSSGVSNYLQRSMRSSTTYICVLILPAECNSIRYLL